jgi:hypothetical protein
MRACRTPQLEASIAGRGRRKFVGESGGWRTIRRFSLQHKDTYRGQHQGDDVPQLLPRQADFNGHFDHEQPSGRAWSPSIWREAMSLIWEG